MKINIDWLTRPGLGLVIDIDSFLAEDDTEQYEESLTARQFIMRIVGVVMADDNPPSDLDEIWVNTYETDGGDDITVDSGKHWAFRAKECLKLAMWSNDHNTSDWEVNRAHAFLSEDWRGYIDELEDLGDKVIFTFDEGDYEALGKEVAEVFDYVIDDNLRDHVDWHAFGESLASDRTEVSWRGTSYIVSE